MENRIGRPFASVTTCSFVLMPPLIRPIWRPRPVCRAIYASISQKRLRMDQVSLRGLKHDERPKLMGLEPKQPSVLVKSIATGPVRNASINRFRRKYDRMTQL